MKNWKIGTRIGAGFGVVILLAIALGLFAFTEVGSIGDNTDKIARESLPKVYLMGQIQANIQANRALLIQHISSTDKQEKAKIERDIETITEKNGNLLSEYEKLFRTVRGSELFNEAKVAREANSSYRSEILAESRLGTIESDKRAAEMMKSRGAPLFARVIETQEAMVAFNKKVAEDTAAEAQSRRMPGPGSGGCPQPHRFLLN